jgi:hypothetical protein
MIKDSVAEIRCTHFEKNPKNAGIDDQQNYPVITRQRTIIDSLLENWPNLETFDAKCRELHQDELCDVFDLLYREYDYSIDMMKRIIDFVDVDYIRIRSTFFSRVLIVFQNRLNIELIRYILDKKPRLNEICDHNSHPLILLCSTQFFSNIVLEIAKMLLEAGSNPNIGNPKNLINTNRSALEIARANGWPWTEMVILFENYAK